MIKQIVFLKKRADLTMEQFIDYYENQHSQLAKKIGAPPPLPNAQRYVRRYVHPEPNPLTGEVYIPAMTASWKSGGIRARISKHP
jgi:hypothetical protein